jgi:RecJ-like exonuclease
MLEKVKNLAEKFLKQSEGKKIQIINHHDTDGICSAAIMASALQRLDKDFSVKTVKQLEKEIIEILPQNDLLLFLDLGSGSLQELNKLKNEIFIIDHHEIEKETVEKAGKNLNIINPHLHNEENLCGACLTYLFVKEINSENKDLANLAIMGMVGDLLEKNIGKMGNSIINDAEMIIKKGLLLYPATRPLNKTLEFSSSVFIPGVTGTPTGAINLLREIGIEKKDGKYKNLIELNEDEMSKLITSILLRKNKKDLPNFIGNIYLIKFFNHLEDARELSAMINACSRLGYSNVAFSLCLGSKKARKKAEKIYARYKQHLIAGLNFVSNLKTEKIEGNNYVIINAKNNIKDTIIGTIASILSMSHGYKEGTIITTMAHNENKIKVSARVAGRNGRNICEILNSVVKEVGGESGGHALAAGCIIPKSKEKEFIETLKKKLEFELVKI